MKYLNYPYEKSVSRAQSIICTLLYLHIYDICMSINYVTRNDLLIPISIILNLLLWNMIRIFATSILDNTHVSHN